MPDQISSVCDILSCVENSGDASYHKKLQFSLMYMNSKNIRNGRMETSFFFFFKKKRRVAGQRVLKPNTPRTKTVRYDGKNLLEQKDRLKKGTQLWKEKILFYKLNKESTLPNQEYNHFERQHHTIPYMYFLKAKTPIDGRVDAVWLWRVCGETVWHVSCAKWYGVIVENLENIYP